MDCAYADVLKAMLQVEAFNRVCEYLHRLQQQPQHYDLTNPSTCLQLILEYDTNVL